MILLDPRAGSQDLLDPLRKAGLPIEEQTLEFGDLAFMGRGEAGADVWIGLEHKKFPDFVQSVVSDRLAGHQLPGLVRTYDRPYLVIEGEWDVDDRGQVVTPTPFRGKTRPMKGCPLASVLEARALTLETRGGVRIRWTRSQKETVRYVSALYRQWTDRDLDEHRSHLAVHAPDMDRALKSPVSAFRKGLMGLTDGFTEIGMSLSRDIENAVGGPDATDKWEALRALPVETLADVPTVSSKGKIRKLGTARAKAIKEALR